MSSPAQPTQWPLRTGVPPPRRDLAAEILELRRRPADGKLTGLSLAIANWLAVDVLLIRTLIVVASLTAGIGAIGYLAGWAITREESSGQAPLDRLGDRWRRLAPRTVLGWALGITALGGLTFGSILGFSWLPLIIIALTVWAGIRAPAPSRQPTGQPAIGQADTRPATPAHQPTWAMTLFTLCVAGLVGGAIGENTQNPPLALSAALLVIGLGLLLAARHGLAIGLVAAGMVVALLLSALILLAPDGRYSVAAGPVLGITDETSLPAEPIVVNDDYLELDLTAMKLTSDRTVTLLATDAKLTVLSPANTNVVVSIEYTNSVVLTDASIDIGDGNRAHTIDANPGGPTMSIRVKAENSRIEVN